MDTNAKVSDPSDFSRTKLPQLSQLDSLLRCHICKDFIKVPVLTPCGHTFCSLCIRGYIDVKARCPLCLNELRESMLRGDILVNEVILCYKSLRDDLIEKLKVEKMALEESNPPEFVEVVSESEINEGNEDDIQIISTNDKSASKITSKREVGSTFSPTHVSLKRGSKESGRVFKRDSSRIQSLLQRKSSSNNKQMAQCPICAQFFPIQTLERVHLDECLTMKSLEGKQGPTRSRTSTERQNSPTLTTSILNSKLGTKSSEEPPMVSHTDRYVNSSIDKLNVQRLPKLDLSSMALSQIKQKLSSLGLPTNGSRQALIERYNYYQMLWNSNFCDSSDPVDETELRRQLMSWEASRNLNLGHSNASSNSNTTSIGALLQQSNLNRHQGNSYVKLLNDFNTDKFDRKQWMVLFRKQFRRLTKEAKSRRATNKATKDNVEKPLPSTEGDKLELTQI